MSGYRTIGLDIGTTGMKAVVFDPDRGIIAQAHAPNQLWSDQPGWAEADPHQWREHALTLVAQLSAEVGPASIRAIATTGMVPAVVAVDATGAPLRRAILQNDARARLEVSAFQDELDPVATLLRTGSPVTQQSVAPTLRWLSWHQPEVWDATRHVVGSYDWVLMSLGAQPHVELNWAIESGLFTLEGDMYEPAVQAADAQRVLAPVRTAGDVVGTLSDDAAQSTGLSTDIALVVGGADHVLSAVGAGLATPGDWLVKLGGAGDILAVTRDAVTDERFYLDTHAAPGLWLPNGCMAASGSLVRWVQGMVQVDDLAAMDALAASRRPAEVLVLPYFLGEKSPLNDPDLRGVIAGLHLGHERADIFRGALEGIAFGFRHNADVFAERGIALERASVTNGGATSLLWKQILASVLGEPLRTLRGHPGAAYGAAFAAALSHASVDGWHRIGDYVTSGDTIEPATALVERYDEAYGWWRELGAASAPAMRAMARS
ncbi:FGGY family carbohydrate kinase [Demequina sp. SO4-13]|uniref:FGGY family carbohydrate kinase n=1 Tax=Demequina sp. SO4-13 TaxID=3401027 RepID=UPI003AF72A37